MGNNVPFGKGPLRGPFLFWLVFAGGAAILMGPGAGVSRGSPRAREIVQRVQQKYEKIQTLVADYEQENEIRSLGRKIRSRGRLYIHKPGRIRFEYTSPEKQLLVSDGKRFWIYTERLKQAILTDLNRAVAGPTPLLFLAGKGKLTESFSISVEEVGVPKRTGGVWKRGNPHRLALTPHRPIGGVRNLWIEVNPESYQIEALEFRDPLGNRTRLRFWNIREGGHLAEGRFRFEVPPGVEVIRPAAFSLRPRKRE